MNHTVVILGALIVLVAAGRAAALRALRVAEVTHIVTRGRFGTVRTLCGQRIRQGSGAATGAPMCPACASAAGWTVDRRRNWR